jgi:hypothetical protein
MGMVILYLRRRENSKMLGWIAYRMCRMIKQSIISERKLNSNKEQRMFLMIRITNLKSKNNLTLNKIMDSENRKIRINKMKIKRRINLAVNR